jgi:hypothetical protein
MKFLGARPQHEDLKLLVEDSDAVEGNLAKFDSSGNPVDSGIASNTVPIATTQNLTFYVNPSTGNDDNNGSSGSPFKTIAKAVSMIPRIVNHDVKIYLADGNYSEGITLTGYVGCGKIFILGNGDYPENVVIAGGIYAAGCSVGYIGLYAMETTNTGDYGIYLAYCSSYFTIAYVLCDTTDANYEGLYAIGCQTVEIKSSTFSNRWTGISAINGTTVISADNDGANNNVGLYAEAATIIKLGPQPGGTTNESASYGGQILSTQLANRDEDAVEGNLAKFDSSGNPVDSGISPSNLTQGLSLIQNGSFEIVDSNSVPWCWEKIGSATLTQDTGVNDGYGGNKALRVVSGGANNEGAKYTFRHLRPSTTYSIRIWMKATAGDTAKAWTTGGSSNLSITSTNTTGEYKTGSFTTDATPTNVILNVGSETNGDIVWFDALTVIEGSTAPDKYLPSPQPTIFEFQDFYVCDTNFPGLETLVGDNVKNKYVYALDDTTEEPLGFNFSIPPNFDFSGFIMLECIGWAKTAAASKNIEYTYYYSPKKYGEDWDTAYSSLVSGDLALYSTQDYRDILRFQLSINTMGVEAYDVVESKIARTAPSANNLTGDYCFEKLRIWIPRV